MESNKCLGLDTQSTLIFFVILGKINNQAKTLLCKMVTITDHALNKGYANYISLVVLKLKLVSELL